LSDEPVKSPIVDVRLFKNLNFLEANGMMFVLELMLFSSLVVNAELLAFFQRAELRVTTIERSQQM
jgi:hypothetical protein